MEKKRRARINSCLTELKTLVLEEMKKDQVSLHHCNKVLLDTFMILLFNQLFTSLLRHLNNLYSAHHIGHYSSIRETIVT